MKRNMERWIERLRRNRPWRDRERGMFFGVCAGLADYYGWNTSATRLAAILCLILFFVPTVLVYVTAALLLPDKPLTYYGDREARLWGGRRRSGRRNYA